MAGASCKTFSYFLRCLLASFDCSEVEEELERLVAVGELARVDYKGSASFRIVQPEAKAKRRRRCPKQPPPTGMVSPNALNNRPPISITNGTVFSAMSPAEPMMPPLTLRTLVIEMLGDSATASIESGVAFTPQFIAKAVEASHRQIYRAAVLGNLDLILAKEVEVGNFIKVGEDQYRISPFASPFQQHHSLLALNPPLAHPPPAPVPVQQLMMESRSISPPKVISPPTQQAMTQPPPPPAPQPPTSSSVAPSSPSSISPLASDEQRKNDLIAAKLSKLEGKSKSPSKKLKAGPVDVKRETISDVEDLPLTVARSVVQSAQEGEISNGTSSDSKKKEDPNSLSRCGSSRKKVSLVHLSCCGR